jgi:hypothetical protein
VLDVIEGVKLSQYDELMFEFFFFLLSPPVESVSEVSSDIKWFKTLPIIVAGDQTMVIPTKFVNHTSAKIRI